MMTRTTPFVALTQEMDRLFESLMPGAVQFAHPVGGRPFPLLNLWEDADNIHVESEIPGLSMDQIEVLATSDSLTIRGERQGHAREKAQPVRLERPTGAFERTIPLPIEVDVDAVQATLKNGVLHVTLPKAQAVRPRRIEVASPEPRTRRGS